MEKLCIKKIVENAGGGMHPSHHPVSTIMVIPRFSTDFFP